MDSAEPEAISTHLEDISRIMELFPEEFRHLQALKRLSESSDYEAMRKQISAALRSNGISFRDDISYPDLLSAWQQAMLYNIPPNQYDAFCELRVVCQKDEERWPAITACHQIFSYTTYRFDDFISRRARYSADVGTLQSTLLLGDCKMRLIVSSEEAERVAEPFRRDRAAVEAAHRAVMHRIADVEILVRQLKNSSGMLGHNNPDDRFRIFGEGVEEGRLQRDVELLGAQPPIPSRKERYLKEIAARLKASASAIREDLGPDGDVFITEVHKSAGNEAGKQLGRLVLLAMVAEALSALAKATVSWIKIAFSKVDP